jgi:hypothetical protein
VTAHDEALKSAARLATTSVALVACQEVASELRNIAQAFVFGLDITKRRELTDEERADQDAAIERLCALANALDGRDEDYEPRRTVYVDDEPTRCGRRVREERVDGQW